MSPARTAGQLTAVVRQLLTLPRETAWVEDKHNNSDPDEIGEYLSALSNSAALEDMERGYLIWGVSDGDRTPVAMPRSLR